MRKAALLAACLFSGAAVFAEDNGRTAAPTLTRLSGAIPAALGGAYAAADGSLDGTFYNPASLARLSNPEIRSSYQCGVAEDSLGTIDAGYALGFGSLFASAGYYDAGTIDLNLSNGVTETRRAQQDSVGAVGVAVGRKGPVALGATAKFFRLTLAEEAHATGTAFDVGALLRTPLQGLTLGLSAVNMGGDVKFEDASDPLPTTGRAGLAYALDLKRLPWFKESDSTVSVFADAVSEKNAGTSGRGGLEIRRKLTTMDLAGDISIRGGYQEEPRAYTAGLGFRLGSFELDYAVNLIQGVDNLHRFTLGWRFSKEPQ